MLRSIDERLYLLRELQTDANARGEIESAQEYARQAEDPRQRAEEIRRLLIDPSIVLRKVAR